MTTIDVSGHSIFYREFGDSALPPLIAVHGLYADSSMFADLGPRLGDHFHVIAPDALGHGRSARPTSFALADQGDMLVGLAAALGYPQTALLGISMGSYLATRAAIDHPSAISSLALIVGKAHGTTSSSVAYAQRMGLDLSTATPEEIPVLMAGALWSPATPQARRDQILATFPADAIILTADEKARIDASLAGFDFRPELSAITARTLVISGHDDGLNPPEAGKELADGIRGARFEVYADCGHMLQVEAPDRLVTDLTAFFAG